MLSRLASSAKITYHAGEDFIDIVDGLRSIDETIRYFQYQRNDRIGHGMALGIEASEYYSDRRGRIVLPMQDLLDNLVWMYYKTLEWNIVIDSNHRARIKDRSMELLSDIFGADIIREGLTLKKYYASMALRGDHPDVYWYEKYAQYETRSFIMYDQCKKPENSKLEELRQDQLVYRLMQRYHYNCDVKRKSRKAADYQIESWYVDIVTALQRAMRFEVANMGIVVECNPTSNYLIGAFRDYTRHPMFRFNSHHLEEQNGGEPQIRVTINTDDIGVFDSTLRNEYAVVYTALREKGRGSGNYDDESIYEYLEMIRENGHAVSFVR